MAIPSRHECKSPRIEALSLDALAGQARAGSRSNKITSSVEVCGGQMAISPIASQQGSYRSCGI
jgi:hypothetical protein